jgi:hypothetical protein
MMLGNSNLHLYLLFIRTPAKVPVALYSERKAAEAIPENDLICNVVLPVPEGLPPIDKKSPRK